jgi:hypothetical protein
MELAADVITALAPGVMSICKYGEADVELNAAVDPGISGMLPRPVADVP